MTQFKTILSDPPWDHESWSDKGKAKAPARHYQNDEDSGKSVMSLKEICKLPVKQIAADDANLLLWTTAPHLEQAMRVIKWWGFKYVSFVPWIKMKQATAPKRGIGYHSMSCCEPLLIAKRGNGCPVTRGELGIMFGLPDALDADFWQDTPEPVKERILESLHEMGVIFHPVGPHSAKPDAQYDWAEHYQGPFLEMFARPDGPLDEPRPHWTRIGNEITGNDITTDLQLLSSITITDCSVKTEKINLRPKGRQNTSDAILKMDLAHSNGFDFG